MSSDDIQVIFEHFDTKFDGFIEAIEVMSGTMGTLARDSDLQEVKADVKTIKITVKATSHNWHKPEERVDKVQKTVYS